MKAQMIKKLILTIVLATMAEVFLFSQHAIGSISYIAGFIDGGGLGIFVRGDYAYIAGSSGGFRVIDISNPTNPYKVGECDGSGGNYVDVFVVGNYAYAAVSTSGFKVIDISNPTNPYPVGQCESGKGIHNGVFVSGNYAYVTVSINGFKVIDISNPTNPYKVGQCESGAGELYDVFVVGNYAYVAADNGFKVIDISNPTNPHKVGECESGAGRHHGVFVVGNYAYVAAGSGLKVIDISNPTNPHKVGECAGSQIGVFVVGSRAYAAGLTRGLTIIDVSEPTNPAILAYFDPGGYVNDVFAIGDYVYITNGAGYFQICRTYHIRGYAKEDVNGSGIENVTVNVNGGGWNSVVTTDSNGDYIINVVPNGDYAVTASKSGYVLEPSSYPSVSIYNNDANNINFYTYNIFGYVRGFSGEGVNGVNVRITGGNSPINVVIPTTNDGSGNPGYYKLEHIGGGTYTIEATNP